MFAPALLPLVLVAAVPQFADDRSPDPAVQVWLDSEAHYERGDLARVFARTARDGYLVVLHADTEGRVRILFPLDPWLDNFVRGGEGIELRTRGDREAFLIEERDGSGLVVAAWSADPFRFDPYVRGDHWDYNAISPDHVLRDPEAALLDIVHVAAAGRRYEYDVAPYLVGDVGYQADYADRSPVYRVDHWTPHVNWRVGFGTHAGFYLNVSVGGGHWYDPWYYDPWYGHDWWPHGRYVVRYPVWYRSVYYDPYYYWPVRPRHVVWDPYWRQPKRYFRTGIGVHVRYAGGDCWSSWRCGDPFPRPGRATGIAYGEGGGVSPWGRFDDRDGRSDGIGRGTAQPRGGNSAARVSDPQVDLGRGRTEVRGIGNRAADPPATSTTETRREQRIPLWPGDAAGDRSATTRTEPPRSRNAGDVVRRAESAVSTETTSDPRRTSGNGIGRRAIEQTGTGPGTDRSSTRTRVIVPNRPATEERARSTGQGRDSRSIGERAGSTEDRSIGRRPLDRSAIPSRSQEPARSSEPETRSGSIGRRSIGSAVRPPTSDTRGNTGAVRSRSTSGSDDRGSSAVRSRSTGGDDRGSSGAVRARSSGNDRSNGVSSRVGSGTSRSSGGTARASSTGSGSSRSSGGSARASSIGSGSSRSSGSAKASSSGSGSSRASSGSARSSGGIGSRARRGGGN